MSPRNSPKRRTSFEPMEPAAGLAMAAVDDVATLEQALDWHAGAPYCSLVLQLSARVAAVEQLDRALRAWAQLCDGSPPPLALMVPDQSVSGLRSVTWDLACQGVYVGAFSNCNLDLAMRHAVRELGIDLARGLAVKWSRRRDQVTDVRGGLHQARALLGGFTLSGSVVKPCARGVLRELVACTVNKTASRPLPEGS